jgi:putative hydrolase of the HAD superfamily
VREFLALGGTDVDDAAADALFGEYLERYEAAWTVFPDGVPALQRARDAGLTVGVLTNGDAEHQRHKMTQMGLLEHVDELISSSVLPASKPDPRAFAVALEVLGAEPRHALMVGNSLEADVRGALRAGLDAVLLDRDGSQAAASDVRRVSTLDELDFTSG